MHGVKIPQVQAVYALVMPREKRRHINFGAEGVTAVEDETNQLRIERLIQLALAFAPHTFEIGFLPSY